MIRNMSTSHRRPHYAKPHSCRQKTVPEQQETHPCSPHDSISQEEKQERAEKEAELATYTPTSNTQFSYANGLAKRKAAEEKLYRMENCRRYFPYMFSVVWY